MGQRINFFGGLPASSVKEIADQLQALQDSPPAHWIMGSDGLWRDPTIYIDYISLLPPHKPTPEMAALYEQVKTTAKEFQHGH